MEAKPRKVEVGQRWGNYTVSHICQGACNHDVHVSCSSEHVHYFEGGWDVRGTLGGDPDYPFRGWAPGYGPSPIETVPPVMEAREDGYPVRCLNCGGDKGDLWFVCHQCKGAACDGFEAMKAAWYNGQRNFPRPSTTPPRPAHLCGLDCVARGCAEGKIPEPPCRFGCGCAKHFQPPRALPLNEMHSPEGVPMTALEKIRSRPKPPPWVPSCDIDCDIPDAPGVTR